jgi:hypothetical protein
MLYEREDLRNVQVEVEVPDWACSHVLVVILMSSPE